MLQLEALDHCQHLRAVQDRVQALAEVWGTPVPLHRLRYLVRRPIGTRGSGLRGDRRDSVRPPIACFKVYNAIFEPLIGHSSDRGDKRVDSGGAA